MAKLKNIIRFIAIAVLFNIVLPAYAQMAPFKVVEREADFIMVGNVNFNLENGYDYKTEATQKIIPINIDESNPSIFNANNAPICLPEMPCPSDGILKAVLSWSGKILDQDRASIGDQWQSVKVRLGGSGAYTNVTANASFINDDVKFADAKGIYNCHADLTAFFNTAINNNQVGSTTFTVANLQSSCDSYTEGEISTKFGGWTLTIIYQKKGKEKMNIAYYPLSSFMPGGLGGEPGDPLVESVELAKQFNGAGDIVVGVVCAGTSKKMTHPYISTKTPD